jgi:hypothetical protein
MELPDFWFLAQTGGARSLEFCAFCATSPRPKRCDMPQAPRSEVTIVPRFLAVRGGQPATQERGS